MALTKGSWEADEAVLTRINSSQISNDLLGLITGSNDKGLEEMFKLINAEGKGAIIFINQQQQSENLLARIRELKEASAKHNSIPKAPPLKMDLKDFGIGAQILHELHINKLRVITNSSQGPRVGITGLWS